MNHTLTVIDTGDHYKRSVVPQILLKGKWLTEAGFTPDQKVVVICRSPGNLEIVSKKELNLPDFGIGN